MEFTGFPKIGRLFREIVITEKIDGTNAAIQIEETMNPRAGHMQRNDSVTIQAYSETLDKWFNVRAQSRTRFITPEDDNYGFGRWVFENADKLVSLGAGVHFGEWWGCLAADTSIRLADGSSETIGKIVNQKLAVDVMSYNFDKKCFESKKVVNWKKAPQTDNWLSIEYKRKHRGGRQAAVNVTPNHVIYTKRNNQFVEVPAAELVVGDTLFIPGIVTQPYQSEITNISNRYAEGNRSKYRFDIEVEGNHNFIANGVLVHNSGIQRAYGLTNGDKRFSLFNTGRWVESDQGDTRTVIPEITGLYVVPTLWRGNFNAGAIGDQIDILRKSGSFAAPGFMRPEGIVIYHTAIGEYFKVTLEKDEQPKGKNR